MLQRGHIFALVVSIAVIVLGELYVQGWLGEWDPIPGAISRERRCRPFPDEVKAWAVRGLSPKPAELSDLKRWASRDPERVNRPYGPTCATPLHEAAETGHASAARILLAHGAQVDPSDEYGNTPLHLAAWYGFSDVAAVLLEAGADPRAVDDEGKTPLHEAALGMQFEERPEGKLAIARMLLDRGADPNAREGGSEWTPLQYVAGREETSVREMAELLIEAGARVDAGDAQGTTALHRAAAGGDVALVARLLDEGADPNVADRFSTALGSAAGAGRVEAARLLLGRGADPSLGTPSSPLPWKGIPLEMAMTARDREGIAAGLEVAELLVQRGADVDARDSPGRTLLHLAAEEGSWERAEFLLDQGADANARDERGVTPLHLAVEHGHLAVAGLLLARGADPGTAASDGATALDLAAMDPEMEALLRRHAAR